MKRAGAPEETDRFAALERIGALAPPILNISGGEPALVKELPALLAKAKEAWNPYIRVVHNGTAPGKLVDSFPYIDRLVISIDGPGGINSATRGINGDTVLEKIADIVSGRPPIAGIPEIIINTVVTETNIGTLPAFSAQIAAVSPRIVHALLPVMPADGALSVLRDRETGYRRFLEVYAEMLKAHPQTVHNLDCVMRHEDWRKIQCYNQYFTIRFSPRGEFFSCGAGLSAQLRRTDGVFKKLFKKGGLRKAFTMFARSIKNRAGKIDFTCRTMCNCDSWLDMLLLGMDTGYAPLILQGFKGRLTDADYKKLDEFARTHISKDFDINRFRDMAGCKK